MVDTKIIADLNKAGNSIIGFIKELMLRKGKNVTYRTTNSLRQATEIDTSFVYNLDILGSVVFEYMNEGRSPNSKMPPKGSLLPWMRTLGIDPAAEYVIRRSIGVKGIKPFPVIDLTVIQIRKQIFGKVAEDVLDTVSGNIRKAAKDGFKFPIIQL